MLIKIWFTVIYITNKNVKLSRAQLSHYMSCKHHVVYHFMLICHLPVIHNSVSSHKSFTIALNMPPFKCGIYFQIKTNRAVPWNGPFLFLQSQHRWQKQRTRKSMQNIHRKKVTGSWINVLNKLSPSTHSRKLPQFSLLIYYKEHPHTSTLWYKIQGNLIFLASFFTKHMYIIFIYQHPWSHPLLQKAFTGESLEVAIHLNEIFLLIKKATCDWLRPWKTGFLQSTHQ